MGCEGVYNSWTCFLDGCKQAFSHITHNERYSLTHGKGPHGGVGATIKLGLDRLVVQDIARLRNAYEVYMYIAAPKHIADVGLHA